MSPDDLLRFVAFHEWRNRRQMVDLAEDLEFVLRYYAKGLLGWPQRLRAASWVLAIRASLWRRRWRARQRRAEGTRLGVQRGFALGCTRMWAVVRSSGAEA